MYLRRLRLELPPCQHLLVAAMLHLLLLQQQQKLLLQLLVQLQRTVGGLPDCLYGWKTFRATVLCTK